MIRPGLTFLLWLAIATLVVLNDFVGDTWIAASLSVRAVEWYKALVPMPYVAMMAVIHARRTMGPNWFEAALLADREFVHGAVDGFGGQQAELGEADAVVLSEVAGADEAPYGGFVDLEGAPP